MAFRQAVIWPNSGILLMGPLEINFSEFLIEINAFLFDTMYLKMSSGKCRPFCLGLNLLMKYGTTCCGTIGLVIPGEKVVGQNCERKLSFAQFTGLV